MMIHEAGDSIELNRLKKIYYEKNKEDLTGKKVNFIQK